MKCQICKFFCETPVKTKCCHKLYCKNCIEIDTICVHCQEKCEFEECILSKRRINELPYKCEYCTLKITRGDRSDHIMKCEKQMLACPVCETDFGKLDLVFHLIKMHNKELMKNMNAIIENFKMRNAGTNQQITIESSRNDIGNLARLGLSGKYYCGNKLDGPSCICCNGTCGIESGCNCSSCMKLDVKARNLPDGWLVNSDGFNARKNGIDGLFYCGRKCRINKEKVLKYCGPTSGKNCAACKKLDFQATERYSAFFQAQKLHKSSSIANAFRSMRASLLNPFDD